MPSPSATAVAVRVGQGRLADGIAHLFGHAECPGCAVVLTIAEEYTSANRPVMWRAPTGLVTYLDVSNGPPLRGRCEGWAGGGVPHRRVMRSRTTCQWVSVAAGSLVMRWCRAVVKASETAGVSVVGWRALRREGAKAAVKKAVTSSA
ncbi:hypothetical protein LRR80_03666 [Streptomyces sp. RO-S4]|nr:hypothetical protein [Streptomyces sp. RO-S4]